jgi:hypothetical protein
MRVRGHSHRLMWVARPRACVHARRKSQVALCNMANGHPV